MVNNLLEKKDGVVQPTKFDDAKVKMHLFPVRALVETNKVFHYGSIVYDEGNWHAGDGFEYSRLLSSMERHYRDFQLGLNYDPESGLPVLAHLVCCATMLLETFLTDTGFDTRAKAQIVDKDEDLSQLMVMPAEVIERAHAKRAKVTQAAEERAKLAGAKVTDQKLPTPGAK